MMNNDVFDSDIKIRLFLIELSLKINNNHDWIDWSTNRIKEIIREHGGQV